MNILKRINKKIILGIVNSLFSGTHFFDIKRKLLNMCEGVAIGENTKIVTPIRIPAMSSLKVGNNCWLGHDFTFEGNGEIIVGNNCDFGPNVTLLTGSHEIGGEEHRAGEGFNGKITIGDGTWVGAKAVLLPNIEIGSGVVIGAASVVTKNLYNNAIFAGTPARKIRDL